MRKLEDYIINCETLLIMPYGEKMSKVYEYDEILIVSLDVITIIKNSCLYFGSSLNGRQAGTKALMNSDVKVPIIVEDSCNIIMFPTNSHRNPNCYWISYNNLLKYSKSGNGNSLLYFKQNNKIEDNIKYNIIDNQVIRCIKLEALINKRKKYSLTSEN